MKIELPYGVLLAIELEISLTELFVLPKNSYALATIMLTLT